MNEHTTILRATVALAFATALGACDAGAPTANGNITASATNQAVLPLKKPAKADGVTVTVDHVEQSAQAGPGGVAGKAGQGETFVIAYYSLKNTGSEPLSVMSLPSFSLIDRTGTSYARDEIASTTLSAVTDASGLSGDINPNVTVRSVAAWKVDRKAFDRATWRVVASTEPQLAFALK